MPTHQRLLLCVRLQKVDLFVNEKPQHLLKFLTNSLKKVNPFFEIADNFYDAAKLIYDEFKKYETELEESLQTTEEHLSNFLNSFLDTKGSLFEHDFFTRLINDTLIKLNEKNSKKNVLIKAGKISVKCRELNTCAINK